MNLYRYTKNNPINFTDNIGLGSKSVVNKDKYNHEVWDYVTEKRIKTLHPMIRKKTKIFINRVYDELWIHLRVSTAFRSIEDQNIAFLEWRTRAQWGKSYHNYWLAIDIVGLEENWDINYNHNWKQISEIGKDLWFW